MLSKAELEELRPWASAILQGRREVVQVALDCIGGSLSRQASTEKLSPSLGGAAGGFVDALYRKVLEIKSAKLASGYSVKRPFSAAASTGGDNDQPSRKKSRFDAGTVHGDVQTMLASTLKQIEERKKQTNTMLTQPGILPTPPPSAVHSSNTDINDAVAKARRAAELQARIQAQLAGKPLLPTVAATMTSAVASGKMSKPVPLVLDAEGKVDMPMAVRQPTLKANIRAQQRAQFRQINREQKTKEDTVEENQYFDPRVTQVGGAGRGKRTLKFNEPGKFIKQAQTMRAKAQLEKLQSEIASTARKTGISSATKLALLAPGSEALVDDVPAVEWWDADILQSRSYGDYDRQLPRSQKYLGVTTLIEHPVPVLPAGVPKDTIAVPLMLTKKERKKVRKQQRREREVELQEKIRLGLVDKPEPKVRISNLMRVLGNDAVQDPTKVEAMVRAQMAERQRKHEQANEARKLTPSQRRTKKIKKLYEDASKGINVAVFRINSLHNQSNRFKVDMNAQQLHLTGCCLVYHDINIVVAEGGAKGIKKYKKLMLHRIKWSPTDTAQDDDDSDNDQLASKPLNSCTLVWEGVRDDRNFSDWKMTVCKSETAARDQLKRSGAEHYWDMALSESIVEQEQD